MKKRHLVAALVTLLSLTLVQPLWARGVAVTLAEVQSTSISERLYATGSLEAGASTQVRTQVSGRITQLNLTDGRYVESGQLLVQLDDREVQARLLQAQVHLSETERQLARDRRLEASQSISQDQLQAREAEVASARAQVQALQTEAERYQIRAPFSGFLGEHDLTPGQLLDAGQTLTTLDDLSQMRVDFALAERHLARIQPGQRLLAQVLAWPEETFEGQIASIGTRIDPNTRNLQIRGRIDNPDQRLRPGMLVTLTLETAERTTLMVPARSLTYNRDEKAVFLVNDQGQVQRRVVETGLTRAHHIEITAGLEAGEKVIDQGVVKVREGTQVRVVEAPLTNDSRDAS